MYCVDLLVLIGFH
uniref:Uncharacterized protein n=1 Tax=Rhizophora mucronata TaxID=61149 RepID=A0A2P2Q4V6_RHIMU